MGPRSVLAEDVDCYNVAKITLEEEAIASQYAYLCTAGHDIHHPDFQLVSGPIMLRRKAWVCAKAIVSQNVEVGEGAVVGIGAVAVEQVMPWSVVGGNPAKLIKMRSSTPQIAGRERTPSGRCEQVAASSG